MKNSSSGDGSLNPFHEWEQSGSVLHIEFHTDGRGGTSESFTDRRL